MDIKEKLSHWQKEGLIDETTAEKILAYEHRQPIPTKIPLLLIIGLIFFSLAVFSFIAANWQAIPAALKIGLMLLLMWLFYGLGHLAQRKNFGWPHIFRLIGLAMFGAAIIVAVQSFHLPLSGSLIGWALFLAAIGHYFYWRHVAYAVVAFVFGIQVLMSSVVTMGWLEWIVFAAVALAWLYFSKDRLPAIFSWLLLFGTGLMLWAVADYDSRLWPIWTLFVLVALLFLVSPEKKKTLQPLYLLAGGALSLIYLSVRGSSLVVFDELNMIESVMLLFAGLAVLALCYFRVRPVSWVSALGTVGLLLYDSSAIGLAILTEAVALSYLAFNHRQNQPLGLGFVYFILVQVVLYFIYAWDRLDMSLFFLIGALLLFALSGIAWWFNRKKARVAS
ncbi:DUF2157 domain-containing protein [Planococcus shenhongbingii]|uniref:DUF2157 domain-containing protein n=1 Tax=Planococcus shenhongbingii TaxID=3058398 RepID=UPI00261113AE|nr:DUF2157 domain-containing protein [Planococcus sp. N016]WKA58765.1 DUF2157 domain-containing protein [Planococcus sp. N016]